MDLVFCQDRACPVWFLVGARHLSKVSLRPADEARLEGVFAVFAVLAGANRRRSGGDRMTAGALNRNPTEGIERWR
jgi:hypothetical protein